MTAITPLLFILSSSLLMRSSADAAVSVFCTWRRVSPSREVHYAFLRTSPSLRLYRSSWSERAELLGCSWSDDPVLTQSYVSLCRERPQQFSHQAEGHLYSLIEEEGLCVSMAAAATATATATATAAVSGGEITGRRSVRSVGVSQPEDQQTRDERSEVRRLQRVKRGFIIPGTLWCGSGNRAPSFDDLGVFTGTDSCCREHDQCKHTILSFNSNFGVFNSNIFTMSHCDCDRRFHRCLTAATDSISDVVGYTFFNLLKMNCFEFSYRLQCAQRNWFGMCKETKVALYAEVHPPTVYESLLPTIINSTGTIPNDTTTSEPLDHFSISAAASTVPTPSTNSLSTFIPVTDISATTATNTPDGPTGPVPGGPGSTLSTTKKTPVHADVTEQRLSCAAFKDLDECRNKILPQQTRYGLYNPDARTIYHCNCSARFLQTLADRTQETAAQTLLLGHVSPSCFLPQDCTAGSICAAVLMRAELPLLNLSSGTEVEQRHLQAVSLKVRRLDLSRSKRKLRAFRLHKLCLRMIRGKVHRTGTHRPAVRRRV